MVTLIHTYTSSQPDSIITLIDLVTSSVAAEKIKQKRKTQTLAFSNITTLNTITISNNNITKTLNTITISINNITKQENNTKKSTTEQIGHVY